jgi:hypothetical protein
MRSIPAALCCIRFKRQNNFINFIWKIQYPYDILPSRRHKIIENYSVGFILLEIIFS